MCITFECRQLLKVAYKLSLCRSEQKLIINSMEIAEIKSRLTLKEVLDHYSLKPDKHLRLNCPFHNDKTPSLQVYWKTHTCYCFSSNCPTHGKALDVIDFILHKEQISKHEAILKAQELIKGNPANGGTGGQPTAKELTRSAVLLKMFTYFKNGVHNSKPAKEYLAKRHLDFEKLEIGYNSGQFHHGTRKDEALIQSCVKYGLLLDKGKKGRTGEPAYQPFGKGGICFALKNREGKITGLYFRSTTDSKKSKHFYLKDRQGLYPNYPTPETKKLILTEAIVDAATLLQQEEITKGFEILSLYGTNGLTDEHLAAIKNLKDLEEVVFWFDGDEAGNKAAEKYRKELNQLHPTITLSQVETPQGEDINSLLDGHEPGILTELLSQRQTLFFSTEKETTESSVEKKKPENPDTISFLKTGNVLENLNVIIGDCGIVGEKKTRGLLFLLTLSYKNAKPLHGIVQGSSGSGKTHLISRIADMMPPEDVLRFTRITEGSLYNWGEYDLFKKVIVIEDLDGLEEKALYALREFISNQVLRSSVTVKDKKGNNKSRKKEVKGQFSSLSATTKGDTYEDNMNRSFLLAVDESQQQTGKIINYQNRRAAGEVNEEQEQENIRFIREVVRLLKPYTVINPFAPKIQLPEKVQQIRRLNEMYQAVIKQVALVNQYQRKTTQDGKLIAQIEDVEQATEILFESIVLKVDELDGALRAFFENLKKYLKDEGKDFTQREIRQHLGLSKTQVFRNIQSLLELEYIKQSGGHPNRGLKYEVSYWDNFLKLREEIKSYLLSQINDLRKEVGTPRNANGTPVLSAKP